MGVYIPGMEMPENDVLELRIYSNGNVYKIIGGYHIYYQPNKAIPVPEHGRLIDADALAEHKFVCIPHVIVNDKEAGTAYRLGWNTAIEAIMENAETIIGGE